MRTRKPSRGRRSPALLGLAAVAVVFAVGVWTVGQQVGGRSPHRHPEPRAGVTGDRVLLTFNLPREIATTVSAYQAAARIPQWLDGIRCYCACGATLGHRSLLSCFEDDHGALCQVCQDEALIASGEAARGGTLEQARQAVDARFGPPT